MSVLPQSALASKTFADVRMERMAACTVVKCINAGCNVSDKRDAMLCHRKTCAQRPPAEVIAELQQRASAAENSFASLLANFRQISRSVEHQFRIHESLGRRVHHFDMPPAVVHAIAENVAASVLDDDRHPLPLTCMIMTTRGKGGPVTLAISNLVDRAQPTACWLVLLPLDHATEIVKPIEIIIPAKAAHSFTVEDWVDFAQLKQSTIREKSRWKGPCFYLTKTIPNKNMVPW